MSTHFATSADGTRIAFDVSGSGPPLILLHGLPVTRVSWHELGYVARWKPHFTVIALDARGNGESDRPTEPEAYALDRVLADVFAVADAAGASRFAVLGFSYGGAIALRLAAHSDRVTRAVVLGHAFGDVLSSALAADRILQWQGITDLQEQGGARPTRGSARR